MFDFECPNGHVHEDLQDPSDNQALTCPECRADAFRAISAVRLDYNGMAMQSGFPTAIDKWEKKQKQRRTKEKDGSNLLMY